MFNWRKLAAGQITDINVVGVSIQLTTAFKSLGVIPDSQLTMANHVASVSKVATFTSNRSGLWEYPDIYQ